MGCILTPPLRILAVMPQSSARILVHTVFSTKAQLTLSERGHSCPPGACQRGRGGQECPRSYRIVACRRI